jgi:hypothetical protein
VRACATVLAAGLAGCTGVTADPGLAAGVRVAGAQFFPGAMPAATGEAQIVSVESPSNAIRAGEINKALSGRLTRDGAAVALGMAGDTGYWTLPAGVLDGTFPDQLDWSARLSFAPDLADGPIRLAVAAVDAAGRFGRPMMQTLTVGPHSIALAGTRLVVSLSWDTEADLDLHVVLPGSPSITVWSKHPSSYVPPGPGEPVDPDALAAAGALDADSNSQCLIDGRREENVIWQGPAATPPPGRYAVLVDTFSLCAAPTAHWAVDVYQDGTTTPIAHAEGTVVDSDTRGEHVASSGVRALVFND